MDGQGLLERRWVGALFRPGQSALGHHWDLVDGEERVIGRTKRVYRGAGKLFARMVTATGMDAGNGIRAEVRDGGGDAVAVVYSHTDRQGIHVDVELPDGTPLGTAERRKDSGFTFLAGPSRTPVGRIAVEGDHPWAIQDASGRQIGGLSRQKADLPPGVDWSGWILLGYDSKEPARDFARTMHLGFDNSKSYWVVLGDEPIPDPLRTFAVLSPVIAGYSY